MCCIWTIFQIKCIIVCVHKFFTISFHFDEIKTVKEKIQKKNFHYFKIYIKNLFSDFLLGTEPKNAEIMLRNAEKICWLMNLAVFCSKKICISVFVFFCIQMDVLLFFFFFVLNYFNTENMLQIYCRKLYDWLLKTVYNVKKKDLYRFFVSLAINWYWKKANF